MCAPERIRTVPSSFGGKSLSFSRCVLWDNDDTSTSNLVDCELCDRIGSTVVPNYEINSSLRNVTEFDVLSCVPSRFSPEINGILLPGSLDFNSEESSISIYN